MKKTSSVTWFAIVIAAMLTFSCQEEPVYYKGADCGGCQDPYPPVIGDGGGLCGDLIISNISFSLIGTETLQIDIELKNVGTGPVYDAKYYLQSYLSEDRFITPFDVGAGGVAREISLAPGQSVVHITQSDNFDILNQFKFIIVEATLDGSSNDCNLTNNTGVKSIW